MGKENIWSTEEKKTEKEKVDNIWRMKRRKIFGPLRRRKTEKERGKIFKKENILRRRREEKKGNNILRGKIFG